MKFVPMLMIGALLALGGVTQAAAHDGCKTTSERGRCKSLPAPPAPPAPPAVPAPPVPVPPMAIRVPESAHAACKDKPAGTNITLSPREGVTMKGSCEKDSRGMYFDVNAIEERS